MATLNFKEIKMYTGIAKKDYLTHDLRETFADIIYRNCNGIAALELARKIYNSDGEAEYNEREVQLIRQVANQCTPQFIDGVNEMLDKE